MTAPQGHLKILVVDDDPVIIKLLTSVLPENGYEVMASQEAPEGLEMAMKRAPDLIILDVMMPIINGFNMCRLMKSQPECRDIPVILLTSRAGDEDRRIGQEVGANAYVSKPFNTQELLAKIRELLDAAPRA